MNVTQQEAAAILQFLERVAITGTQERNNMNAVAAKLVQIANPAPPEAGTVPPKSDDPE
jgi:hypothetical protein